MSKQSSPRSSFIARLVLAALPLLTFPAALVFLCYNYAALVLVPQNTLRRHIRRSNRFRPYTVVVTGISSPAGLRVARALYQTGHNVIGVEVFGSKSKWLSLGQWSRAVKKVYTIQPHAETHDFVQKLLSVIASEEASLWIDCHSERVGQAQARHVVERKTSCVCIVPDVDISQKFESRYDFLEFIQSLSLPKLEMHRVRSRHDVHSVLNDAKGKKYLLSTTNGNDNVTPTERAILPRRTPSQTYQDVSQLKISQKQPWLLEQYIDGLSKYAALAIVIHGKVRAFVVSSDELGGSQLLPPQSGLSRAMQNYMQDLADRTGSRFSGHVRVDFCVDEKTTNSGVVQQILPIGAQLSATPALIFFSGSKGSINLTKAYLSSLDSESNGLGSFTGLPYSERTLEVAEAAEGGKGIFELDESVLSFLILPTLQLLLLKISVAHYLKSLMAFSSQLLFWRELVYEFWDPLPAFIVYFVYTGMNLRRWRGMNFA